MKHVIRCIVVLTISVAICGCIPEKRVVWSPDGQRAAVIGGDGLYLCDENGALSSRLVDKVTLAEWLPDSQHLAIVRRERAKTWAEVVPLLSAERRARIEAAGDALFEELQQYQGALDGFDPQTTKQLGSGDTVAAILYARDHDAHGAYWRGDERGRQVAQQMAEVQQDVDIVQICELTGDQVSSTTELCRGVDGVNSLRVAPTSGALAIVVQAPDRPGALQLQVVSTADRTPARVVATDVARWPDWSADGQYLAYAVASGPSREDDEALRLGTISRRRVARDTGRLLEAFEAPEELAGILFQPVTRVRCLRDGRVLFAGVEVALPCTAADMPERAELFCVDPGRQPGVTRLIPRQVAARVPDTAYLFSVSPDERHVCIPGGNGDIALLELATGQIVDFRDQPDGAELRTQPCWRGATELCCNTGPSHDDPTGRGEIMLWQPTFGTGAGRERVISADWPASLVADFLVMPKDRDAAAEAHPE